MPALSAEVIDQYVLFAQSYHEGLSSGSADNDAGHLPDRITASTFSSLRFGGDAASSVISYSLDLHVVSKAESQSYYASLPS